MDEVCRKCAKAIFHEIEREPVEMGIEGLAKKFPDQVRFIAFDWPSWQKFKRRFL